MELSFDDNNVIALKNQVDTWAYNYQDILAKLFDTADPIPTKTVEEMEYLLTQSDDPIVQESLKDNIDRLKESEVFEDELAEYERSLLQKQQELDTLLDEYKAKIK